MKHLDATIYDILHSEDTKVKKKQILKSLLRCTFETMVEDKKAMVEVEIKTKHGWYIEEFLNPKQVDMINFISYQPTDSDKRIMIYRKRYDVTIEKTTMLMINYINKVIFNYNMKEYVATT